MNQRQSRMEANPEKTRLSAPQTGERLRISVDLVRRHIASGRLASLHIAPGFWEGEKRMQRPKSDRL